MAPKSAQPKWRRLKSSAAYNVDETRSAGNSICKPKHSRTDANPGEAATPDSELPTCTSPGAHGRRVSDVAHPGRSCLHYIPEDQSNVSQQQHHVVLSPDLSPQAQAPALIERTNHQSNLITNPSGSSTSLSSQSPSCSSSANACTNIRAEATPFKHLYSQPPPTQIGQTGHVSARKQAESTSISTKMQPQRKSAVQREADRLEILSLTEVERPVSRPWKLQLSNPRPRQNITGRHIPIKLLPEDDSFPLTPAMREDAVAQIVNAMRSIEEAKDKITATTDFKDVWLKPGLKQEFTYNELDMERVCRDLVSIAETLHAEGLGPLKIYCPRTIRRVMEAKPLPFRDRINKLAELMRKRKSRCDSFMLGNTMEDAVALIEEKLRAEKSNGENNNSRSKKLEVTNQFWGLSKRARWTLVGRELAPSSTTRTAAPSSTLTDRAMATSSPAGNGYNTGHNQGMLDNIQHHISAPQGMTYHHGIYSGVAGSYGSTHMTQNAFSSPGFDASFKSPYEHIDHNSAYWWNSRARRSLASRSQQSSYNTISTHRNVPPATGSFQYKGLDPSALELPPKTRSRDELPDFGPVCDESIAKFSHEQSASPRHGSTVESSINYPSYADPLDPALLDPSHRAQAEEYEDTIDVEDILEGATSQPLAAYPSILRQNGSLDSSTPLLKRKHSTNCNADEVEEQEEQGFEQQDGEAGEGQQTPQPPKKRTRMSTVGISVNSKRRGNTAPSTSSSKSTNTSRR